jgi:prevent-host-death family protein
MEAGRMGKMMTSREFNQNVSGAKRFADDGPVVITDRGAPVYVLMRHEEFQKLTKGEPSLLDVLGHVGGEDIDLQASIPSRRISQRRPIDFS